MNERTLGHWPIFMMLTLSVGLSSHVIVLPSVLDVSRRDAWMCAIIAYVIVVPWISIFLYGTIKRTKQTNLRVWLAKRMTPAGAWVLLVPVMIFLLLTSFQSFIETTSWTTSTFLPSTPDIVILVVLMLLNVFGAFAGLRTIAFMSCMLLPAVVILGDFVMSANMPHKDYSVLLPMLEHGWGAPMHGAIYSLSCAMELFLFLFLQHHMRNKIRLWQIILLATFIMVLMVGPTIGAITEFGPVEAEKLRYPAFSQWRLVSIGKYFEHVDFFAIFQWMSGAFIRVTLGIVLILELIPIRSKRSRLWTLAVFFVVYIGAAKWLSSLQIQISAVLRIVFMIDLIIIAFVTIVIWSLSFKGAPKGSDRVEESQHVANDSANGASNNI